ncbi:MAG: metallophosphoesterase [Pseudanabaenaceae cyanobacterium SKYGB_i_bin29]|nr:metallophosphoesterase [Pseudanabaenaceae cyanobacterium SKYG29]MDW8422274.1 metallophosphoesterase [Pseudanabaenaceae cyanobacterium SKYGB_i_bin29]
MTNQVRFGIISDPHITLPHTLWHHPSRFHLLEWSIPAFEIALAHLLDLGIDFLLLPGDLTQHGEAENHQWLADRLRQLPVPAYLIPGNHDVPTPQALAQFSYFYRGFGYREGQSPLCYSATIAPGIRLIGLNSNCFAPDGEQLGTLTTDQLQWLTEELAAHPQDLIWVMIHHNLVPHLPGQENSHLGKRYMLANGAELLSLLQRHGVKVAFTGHLHVQDVAYSEQYDFYDITTGSTVSFPHPYRHLTYEFQDDPKQGQLHIQSFRVQSVPGCPDLQQYSREWMGERSGVFLRKLLVQAQLNLSEADIDKFLPHLRYLWADIANGDAHFSFPQFPSPLKDFVEGLSDRPPADNECTLHLS